MICQSFAPVVSEHPRVLILGSMPGVASLNAGQYYAHPRNAFWPILFAAFDRPFSQDYETRCRLIREQELALWDVARSCIREGSLDADMKCVAYNPLDVFLQQYPDIRTVLCNGNTAFTLFRKSGAGKDRCVLRMPSTSPAYTIPYSRKEEAWKSALSEALRK